MPLDPLAGQPVPPSRLPDVPRIVAAYYTTTPDPEDPAQRVAFGTSGHRGRSLDGAFTEAHVLAISQALVEHRAEAGIDGPMVVGYDTHALSYPAFGTAMEVFAAHGVDVIVQQGGGVTPTPSSPTTAAARPASPTASSSRPATTRPKTAASSTTPPRAAPRAATSPAPSRPAPTRSSSVNWPT